MLIATPYLLWKGLEMGMFNHRRQQSEVEAGHLFAHLGARNSRKAFHQNIGHFHYFLSEMYNSKY
jgi:hypothetical protein